MSVGRHSAVDRILDRTVALGYSRIGYVVRRRWWQDEPAPGSLRGKHVLITGSTSGIGRAAAARCAASGAEVHVHGHNPERGAQAISWLTSRVPRGIFHLESCDLQSLADVQRFAEDFSRRVPALHALVHNAGVMSPEREETVDGHERTLAVHVLSPHLLTDLLRGSLAGAEGGRIVFMSSGGMYAQTACCRSGVREGQVLRLGGLRAHEAHAGHPCGTVGNRAGRGGDCRTRDASRLGGHLRRADLPPEVQIPDQAVHPDP